jgi:retinol dehydrogenase-12
LPIGALWKLNIPSKNVLGHWYFTKLLVPSLLAADEPRVVHTASLASRGGVIQFDTMRGKDAARSTKSTAWLYNQSKLGNVIVAREFAQRYPGIVSTSLNPGNIRTELTRHVNAPEWFLHAFRQLLLYPVELGAVTQLYAGTAPEAKDLNGQYLVPWARLAKPNPLVHDAELCARVWDWCEDQVKDL